MFPITINARHLDFTSDNTFGLGAMADSFYEYLPKVERTVYLKGRGLIIRLGVYASWWSFGRLPGII